MWKIDFDRLKKAQELNHCLCDLSKTCPCDEFLNIQECICGAFKKVKE